MKKLCLILVLAAVLAGAATPGFCTGIPTVDVANLTQNLTSYLQQIKEFQELLSQSTTMTNQYMQMIRDYQQVLREYNSYLRQVRSLKGMMDRNEWSRMMRTIKDVYGRSKKSILVQTMDPDSPTYEDDLNLVLGESGYVPRPPAEVEADARELGIWSDEYARQVRRDYENYEQMKDRMRKVTGYEKQSDQRVNEDIPDHANTLDSLGDESELATMQAMAQQNLTIMRQLESQVKIQNQMLLNQENAEARRAAQAAEYRDKEMQRLRNRKPTQLLGRDRWGYFD